MVTLLQFHPKTENPVGPSWIIDPLPDWGDRAPQLTVTNMGELIPWTVWHEDEVVSWRGNGVPLA